MNRSDAAGVRDRLLPLTRELHLSLRALMRSGSPAERVARYGTVVSFITGYVYRDILRPLFIQYPDLEPPEWSEGTRPVSSNQALDAGGGVDIQDLMKRVLEELDTLHKAPVDELTPVLASGIVKIRGRIKELTSFLSRDVSAASG